MPASQRWPDIKSLIAIESTREEIISGKTTTETRFYISSRHMTPQEATDSVRSNWLIENQLHWCLDVSFGQDTDRTRTKYAAENFAVVRHFALNLVRSYTGDRYSVPRRRRLCDCKASYRQNLLGLQGRRVTDFATALPLPAARLDIDLAWAYGGSAALSRGVESGGERGTYEYGATEEKAMLRRLLVVSLVPLTACTTDPGEAAKGSHVTITDGFRSRSGVVIAGKHMLVDFEMVETIDKTNVRVAGEEPEVFRVLKRDPVSKLAVLYDAMASLSTPSIDDSGVLQKGAPLTAVLWEGEAPEVRTGQVTGWRYHEGKAYIETDLHLPDAGKAAGVYDARGGLIGLYAFRFTSKLNYVLPIEYALSTPNAVGKGLTGAGASDEFKRHYVAGTKHPDPLVPPQDFDTIIFEYSFSRSALVGLLMMLDKKDAPSHAQDVAYELFAKNADGEERSIGKGKIEAANRRWAASPELQAARAKELEVSYGADFVKDNFAPYDFGELRWRVPLAPHCQEIKEGDSFELHLTLADGRNTEPLPFRDLNKVCAGTEMSEGDNWEQAWGMVPAAGEPAAPPPKATTKSKKKKKKKKKKHKKRH